MGVYDLEFNKDDVLIRNIIIGILAEFHNRINWKVKDDGKEKVIRVPFYFSVTGDERWLQDNLLNEVDCPENGKEFYAKIPRGVIQLQGIEIDSGGLTNSYVRANYDKKMDDGTLRTFNAEFIPIPLVLQMDVSIFVDTVLDQFKCVDSIIRNFYKESTFHIHVNGIRLPVSFSVPENTEMNRTIEFRSGSTDTKEMSILFPIDIQLLYPVFKNEENGFMGDKNTEMFRGNVMYNLSFYKKDGMEGGSKIHVEKS